MNKDICLCGHPKGRHDLRLVGKDERVITSILGCMHCSCKEFYASEDTVEPVEEWPKKGDRHFYIYLDGDIMLDGCWKGNEYDVDVKNFLGVYRTREEAESVRDKVREFMKSLKK